MKNIYPVIIIILSLILILNFVLSLMPKEDGIFIREAGKTTSLKNYCVKWIDTKPSERASSAYIIVVPCYYKEDFK